MKSIRETLTGGGLRLVFRYLEGDYEESLPKLLQLVKKLDRHQRWQRQIDIVEEALHNPESEESHLLRALWTELSPATRKELLRYAILHGQKFKN